MPHTPSRSQEPMPLAVAVKPYSVKTLAERWDCSEAHVRAMVKTSKLRAFTLGGKMIRIAAEEVARWETTQNLSGTGESLPSHSSRTDNECAVRLARLTLPSARLDLQNSTVSVLSRTKAGR